jgi:hypothetical protein
LTQEWRTPHQSQTHYLEAWTSGMLSVEVEKKRRNDLDANWNSADTNRGMLYAF